jgi:hypothetical protein
MAAFIAHLYNSLLHFTITIWHTMSTQPVTVFTSRCLVMYVNNGYSSASVLKSRTELSTINSTNWVPVWRPFHTYLLVFSWQADFQQPATSRHFTQLNWQLNPLTHHPATSRHFTQLTTEPSHSPSSYFTSLHSTEPSLAIQLLHVTSLNWTDNWTVTHHPATSRHFTQLTTEPSHSPSSYFTSLHSTDNWTVTHQPDTTRHFTQLTTQPSHSPSSYFTSLHSTELTTEPSLTI